MNKFIIFSFIAAVTLGLTGCGDTYSSSTEINSDGNSSVTPTLLSAQFIDAAVEGLAYDCSPSGTEGFTDHNGYFNYVEGDTCYFFVGDTNIGGTEINGTITPRTLTRIEPYLTNILRLLQTLDTDENPSNGITLPLSMTGNISLGRNFDSEIQGYLNLNNVQNALVTDTEAQQHFEQSVPFSFDNFAFYNRTYKFNVPMGDDFTFVFHIDHTFSNSIRENGTWSIENDILILTISDSTRGYDIVLNNYREANLTQYRVSDGARYVEQALINLAYVTHTPSAYDLIVNEINLPHPELVDYWSSANNDSEIHFFGDILTETTGYGSEDSYTFVITGDIALATGGTARMIKLQLRRRVVNYEVVMTYGIENRYEFRRELIIVQGDTMRLTTTHGATIYPSNLSTAKTYTRWDNSNPILDQ